MVHHNHQYIVRGSSGQSLIEVLVAIGIGVLFIVAAVSLIAPALKVNTTANSAQTAGALSKELGDNVRAWAGGSWNNVFSLATSSANQYYLNTLFSPFAAAQGTETITAGSSTYQRYFYVDDVYRDSNGNATSTASGNSYDPSTKKITIVSVPATLGPAISSWPTTTPSSYATQSASAVAYNGYIYETGGEDPQTGDSTSGVIYAPINSNGTVGTWSPTTGMPLGLTLHSAVVYNGYIYTKGGKLLFPTAPLPPPSNTHPSTRTARWALGSRPQKCPGVLEVTPPSSTTATSIRREGRVTSLVTPPPSSTHPSTRTAH